jgi:hypothetical protein
MASWQNGWLAKWPSTLFNFTDHKSIGHLAVTIMNRFVKVPSQWIRLLFNRWYNQGCKNKKCCIITVGSRTSCSIFTIYDQSFLTQSMVSRLNGKQEKRRMTKCRITKWQTALHRIIVNAVKVTLRPKGIFILSVFLTMNAPLDDLLSFDVVSFDVWSWNH